MDKGKTLKNLIFYSLKTKRLPHDELRSEVICGDYICCRPFDDNAFIQVMNIKKVMASIKKTNIIDYEKFVTWIDLSIF